MTLPTGNKGTPSAKPHWPRASFPARTRTGPSARGRGFTLVELILVMTMLGIVIGLAAPTLSHFFRGRALDTEAVRFLALTRYGQSRAVSAGTPMILWVQRREGTYGLREEARYSPTSVGWQRPIDREPSAKESRDEIPMEYQLAKDLRFEIDMGERLTNDVGTIRFWPDGSIDENSLRLLWIRDKDEVTIPIVQARNRLKYEIADKRKLLAGAYD